MWDTSQWEPDTDSERTHPMPGGGWLKLEAVIREVATGEVRIAQTIHCVSAEDERFNPYWWSEGNGSCDCNRELYFRRAAGNDDENTECSDGRFQVNLRNPKTGEVVYQEFS